MSDTSLTVVRECIKYDLNTQYQNEAMSLLLDTCVCLDLASYVLKIGLAWRMTSSEVDG